jgi:hypothetical protein
VDAGSLRGEVVFKWSYDPVLGAGEAFQVLIWRVGTLEHLGAADFWRQTEQMIDLDSILPERGGPGQYWWTVVVVNSSTGQRLSPEAGPWQLTYPGPRTPVEPTAQPAQSPVIKPTDAPPPPLELPTLSPPTTLPVS